ncbi:MAG: hypothetical protein A3K65_01900 [Euryarchaeota archaeon RBG_16_68_12]|nr:MAG: hypothetical protein A3K65_01900 [Euryarchaeota archaeon RBG_16_68_12]
MLAGFVDGRGRAYDVGFRTLRFSLVGEDGLLETAAGEEVRSQGAATAAADLIEPRAMPFLLLVRGELTATARRVVFLAAAGLDRRDPVTFFNVGLSLQRTAVEHFFTAQAGREFLQFEKADVESTWPSGPALEAVLRGPRPGRAAETARYRLRLEPRRAAEEALAALE